jgi:hypothetical protein
MYPFLFEEEKNYLITCTSEILPLFLLKKEKDKANVREKEKERTIFPLLSLSFSVSF